MFISLGEEIKWEGLPLPMPPMDHPLQHVFLYRPSSFEVLAYSFPMLLGIVLGSISFTGSMVAFGKLQGLISEKPLRWPMQKLVNILLVVGIFVAAWASAAPQSRTASITILAALALLLGYCKFCPLAGRTCRW